MSDMKKSGDSNSGKILNKQNSQNKGRSGSGIGMESQNPPKPVTDDKKDNFFLNTTPNKNQNLGSVGGYGSPSGGIFGMMSGIDINQIPKQNFLQAAKNMPNQRNTRYSQGNVARENSNNYYAKNPRNVSGKIQVPQQQSMNLQGNVSGFLQAPQMHSMNLQSNVPRHMSVGNANMQENRNSHRNSNMTNYYYGGYQGQEMIEMLRNYREEQYFEMKEGTKRGFDYEFLTEISSYIIEDFEPGYIDQVDHADLIRGKRAELEIKILSDIDEKNKSTDSILYFKDKDKRINTIHYHILIALKKRAEKTYKYIHQKEEDLRIDCVKLLKDLKEISKSFRASEDKWQRRDEENKGETKRDKDSDGNIDDEEIEKVIKGLIKENFMKHLNYCSSELLNIQSFFHINKMILDYLLFKQDLAFENFQHSKRKNFLDGELSDQHSYIFLMYTNGMCFKQFIAINSVVLHLNQFLSKIDFKLENYDEMDEQGFDMKSSLEEILSMLQLNWNICMRINDYFDGFFNIVCKKLQINLDEKTEKSVEERLKLYAKSFLGKVQKKNPNIDHVADYNNLQNAAQLGVKIDNEDDSDELERRESATARKMLNVDTTKVSKPTEDDGLKACYSMIDLWLVLIHTYLFMGAYYGMMLTSSEQAVALGLSKGTTGVLNAFTPIGAGISCFQYNWHTTVGYHNGYIVSWALIITGTLLISLAQSFDSVIVLTLGRQLFGYGGARTLTRKFVAQMVTTNHRAFWSAMLVCQTCCATCTGPGFNSMLSYMPSGKIGPFIFESYNILVWICFPVYILYTILFFCLFSDQGMKDLLIKKAEDKKIKEMNYPKPNVKLIKKRRQTLHVDAPMIVTNCPEILPDENLEEKVEKENSFSKVSDDMVADEEIFEGKIADKKSMSSLDPNKIQITYATNPEVENLPWPKIASVTDNNQNGEGVIMHKIIIDFEHIYESLFYYYAQDLPKKVVNIETKALLAAQTIEDDEIVINLPCLGLERYVLTEYNDTITYMLVFFFFQIKASQEAYITEIPIVTYSYYDWSPTKVGYIWLITTIIAVPASLLVAIQTNWVSEKKIYLGSQLYFMVCMFAKINYRYKTPMNMYHYMTASTCFFTSTLMAEAITITIMSRVISEKKAWSVLNVGLMSGLADTFGRGFGSISITVVIAIVGIEGITCVLYSFYAFVTVVFVILSWVWWGKIEKVYYVKVVGKND